VKRICVFCGSNNGASAIYSQTAVRLGVELAARNLTLVYGGGHHGLMGTVADAVMKAGGEVIGVIPQALVRKEQAHFEITSLHVVGSMHERKAMMADLADGFIALPGGFGTFEELIEILTWAQLGFHHKPCGVVNVAGYYDGLLSFFDHATRERFIRSEHRSMVLAADDPVMLLDRMLDYQAPVMDKWIDRNER
jgi:hypothetical protein